MTVRCHEIWSIFLVPDCITDSINLQSGLRQQWTRSQLIPSEVTCVLCSPTPAFNTSTNHFCCVNVWGPGTTHCSQACQSYVYLSVGAHLTFFYKNNRPTFQTFQNRRNSGSRYFKPSRTARFHRRTSGYLTFSNVFVDHGLYISEKLGVWCFLRTAIKSLKNRGDIRK